ncbi:MAG: hypothetical protein FJ014_04400 [Chloroflexi bacterium]|nr:hypothetical protein [Chloroflexota bacterium]
METERQYLRAVFDTNIFVAARFSPNHPHPHCLPLANTAALCLERQPLESLTALNSTEVTERSAILSAFSALSSISGSTPPAWPGSSGCGKRRASLWCIV